MAGNVWEWTTENCKINGQPSLVARGGCFDNHPSYNPAAYRGNGNDSQYSYIGFRTMLYIA